MTANLASSLLISISLFIKNIVISNVIEAFASIVLRPLTTNAHLLFQAHRNHQKSSIIGKLRDLFACDFVCTWAVFSKNKKQKKQSRKNHCLKTKNQCIFSRPRVLNATFFLWGADRTENPWLAEMQIRNA